MFISVTVWGTSFYGESADPSVFLGKGHIVGFWKPEVLIWIRKKFQNLTQASPEHLSIGGISEHSSLRSALWLGRSPGCPLSVTIKRLIHDNTEITASMGQCGIWVIWSQNTYDVCWFGNTLRSVLWTCTSYYGTPYKSIMYRNTHPTHLSKLSTPGLLCSDYQAKCQPR